jgi:hypothetical protein
MPPLTFIGRHVSVILLVMLVSVGFVTVAGAQSQEPKPALPATPIAETDPPVDPALSGVSGSSWEGPNSGVRVSWDPAIWSVEGEFIDAGFDGLQLGTPISTVYLEAYDDFGGDAGACFTAAEQELGEREAGLFGITATLPDGTIYRGVEYVECRTIVPGQSVLEVTWLAVTQAFSEDFPHVETLLAAIEMPTETRPAATPVAPLATPVA